MKSKQAVIALFTSFALVLSYLETFFPVVGIAGVKLGLANLAVLLSLYLLGGKEALIVNFVRILIAGMSFGNLFSICYSIAGALFSMAVMALLKKWGRVSIITVGITGGVFHNIGQLLVAAFLVETYGIFSYVPVLLVSGIITGAVIGVLSDIIYRRTKNVFNKVLGKGMEKI